jgi:hypothetical protein
MALERNDDFSGLERSLDRYQQPEAVARRLYNTPGLRFSDYTSSVGTKLPGSFSMILYSFIFHYPIIIPVQTRLNGLSAMIHSFGGCVQLMHASQLLHLSNLSKGQCIYCT